MRLIFSVTGVLFTLPLLGSCNAADPPIVKACESAVKERVGTYQRVNIAEVKQPLSREDFYNHLYQTEPSSAVREEKMKEFDEGKLQPIQFALMMHFKRGSTLDTFSYCEYLGLDGTDLDASISRVVIDKMTRKQWRNSRGLSDE